MSNNPFGFIEQPYLSFLQDDSPHSNSLLAQIFVKQQHQHQNLQNDFNQVESMQNQNIQQNQNSYQEQNQNHNHPFNKSKSKVKQKKKIFYRDKMAELMNQENYIKQQYNYIDFAQIQKGKSPISRDEQLKRNRQSAKLSRQRKKQYVQTLQDKAKNYQKQIVQLTQRLRQAELQRDRLKDNNHSQLQCFNKLKADYFQKLALMIQKIKKNKLKINKQKIAQINLMNKSGLLENKEWVYQIII